MAPFDRPAAPAPQQQGAVLGHQQALVKLIALGQSVSGGGGGGLKLKVINFMLDKPAVCYLGGAAVLHSYRWYQTKTTYNYWFGKNEFERRFKEATIAVPK